MAFGPDKRKMHKPDRPKGVERAKIVDMRTKAKG